MQLTIDGPLAPWQPTASQPWDVRRVIHLHRRAGLGANWTEVRRDLNAGPQAAIERILNPIEDQPAQEFEQLSQVIGSAAVAANNISRLQAWWLLRMLRSSDPLRERLTLMWHNHFATSHQKVQDVDRMHTQNEIFRRYARASFHDLLPAVIKDPAMLVWLDADSNRQEHPNENLAREIMELFTLGVEAFHADGANADSATGYTEHDVQQAARALTGWTASGSGFRFNAKAHDADEKTIFSKRGSWDGNGLMELLLEHPATPRRLAWRMCQELMGQECATEELIAALAEQLRESNLNVGRGVETLLRSQAFFDDANIGSRISSPIEFIVGSLRALEMLEPPPSTLLLAEWSTRMGQALFHPPNVFGWPGGRAWMTTRTVIGRANFVENLVRGQLHNPARPFDASRLAGQYGFSQREQQLGFYSKLLLGDDIHTEQNTEPTLEDSVVELLTAPRAQLW